MPLLASVDVAVSLWHFQNVDLHNQGLYRVSVSLALAPGPQRLSGRALRAAIGTGSGARPAAHLQAPAAQRAVPYSHFEWPLAPARVAHVTVPGSCEPQAAATIDEARSIFYSKAFRVRYVDERRELRDGVVFRLELDFLRDRNTALRLRVCLERADLEKNEGDPRRFTYETLSARCVDLNHAVEGIHEYLPVIFDDTSSLGFALAESSVHTCMTRLRYEPPNGHAPEPEGALAALQLAIAPAGTPPIEEEAAAEAEAEANGHLAAVEKVRHAAMFALRGCYSRLGAAVGLARATREKKKSAVALDDDDGDDGDEGPLLSEAACAALRELPEMPALEVRVRPKGEPCADFARAFASEMDEVSGSLLLAWHAFFQALKHVPGPLGVALKDEWLRKARERSGEGIIREWAPASEVLQSSTTAKRQERLNIADKIRKSAAQMREFEREPVEDSEVFQDPSSYPVVFEQRYGEPAARPPQDPAAAAPKPAPALPGQGCRHGRDGPSHLIVLVHGFMGSSWDLRAFRNYISIIEPRAVMLLSKANEQDTDSDIGSLGFRLALEVSDFCRHRWQTPAAVAGGRLSFVCHSIGSVIVRSALTYPRMAPYVGSLHTILSLSSPHLGTRALSSTLVKVGMLAVRYMRKAKALAQLAMADDPDPRETFLYHLSKASPGLRDFQHVVLISSAQDQYVPYHSARVEPLLGADGGSPGTEHALAAEMAANLLGGVDPSRVMRLDLSFQFDNTRTARVDKLIGRAAHVKILDSPALALMLLLQYHERLFAAA